MHQHYKICWGKGGKRVSSTRDDILTVLYSLIRWILVGSEEPRLEAGQLTDLLDHMSEYYVCLQNQETSATYTQESLWHIPNPHSQENPQVLGLALTVHHDTRNKMLMDLLHVQNYHVSYNRTLLLEKAIAKMLLWKTQKKFDGLYDCTTFHQEGYISVSEGWCTRRTNRTQSGI